MFIRESNDCFFRRSNCACACRKKACIGKIKWLCSYVRTCVCVCVVHWALWSSRLLRTGRHLRYSWQVDETNGATSTELTVDVNRLTDNEVNISFYCHSALNCLVIAWINREASFVCCRNLLQKQSWPSHAVPSSSLWRCLSLQVRHSSAHTRQNSIYVFSNFSMKSARFVKQITS